MENVTAVVSKVKRVRGDFLACKATWDFLGCRDTKALLGPWGHGVILVSLELQD